MTWAPVDLPSLVVLPGGDDRAAYGAAGRSEQARRSHLDRCAVG